MAGHANGNTVDDAGNPVNRDRTAINKESIPGMGLVSKMLTYADEMYDTLPEGDLKRSMENPHDPMTAKRRAFTRPMIQPTLEHMARFKGGRSNPLSGEWTIGSDSLDEDVEAALLESIGHAVESARMDSLATTTSVMYNQPTIYQFLVVQSFQDMRAPQFVKVFGPGSENTGNGGWQDFGEGIGSVFRLPYESYTNPGGTGFQLGTADGGLLTTQGAEIQAGTTNISWKSFAPIPRAIAATLALEPILQMGKGPLNLSIVTRNLLHMAARKCRTIDTALQNEMAFAAMEYNAVVVTSESPNLPDNSVFPASGLATVNLNPTKIASAAVVASTDKFVVYGTNVIGAVRMVTGGSNSASPYVGTNGWQPNPVVVPRVLNDINAAGQATSTTLNPITVTAPGAAVPGLLAGGGGGDYQIYNDGSGAVATYAMDYAHGVLVFKSGVTGSAESSRRQSP